MQICQQNSSTDNNRTVGRRVPNDVHVYKHDTTLAIWLRYLMTLFFAEKNIFTTV